MKTKSKQISSRIFAMILFINLLFIGNAENIFAQCTPATSTYPSLSANNITTGEVVLTCASSSNVTATMYVNTGDQVTFYMSQNLSGCGGAKITGWCGNSGCVGTNPYGAYGPCTFSTAGGPFAIIATFFTNSSCSSNCPSTGTITVNVYVTACAIFSASNNTNTSWPSATCTGSGNPSAAALYSQNGEQVNFTYNNNSSGCSYVLVSGNTSQSTSCQINTNITGGFNETYSTGNYSVSVAPHNPSTSCNSICGCAPMTIDIHVGQCPVFIAQNMTSGCFAQSASCAVSSTSDLYITSGDQVDFSINANYSYCVYVTFTSSNSGVCAPGSAGPASTVSSWSCSPTSDVTITATYTNSTGCSANTCCSSSCTATINVHVLPAFFHDAATQDYIYDGTTNCPTTAGSSRQGVVNTGNDETDIGPVVHVSVWDGAVPRLGWNYNGACGTIALGNSAVSNIDDPDVCLVHTVVATQSEVMVIAAYYGRNISTGNYTYYLESFYFSGGAYVSGGLTVLKSYGSTNQSAHVINIDSDEEDHFAVVWEDASNKIWCNTGSLNSTTLVLACNAPNYIDVSSSGSDGKMPDVAMHDGGSGNETIFISYIRTSVNAAGFYQAGDLAVESETYAYITTPFCDWNGHVVEHNASPQTTNYTFSYPRIAANGAGTAPLWTVVLEERYATSATYPYLISGFTYNASISSTAQKHIYNDGGNYSNDSPWDISNAQNDKPVVSYSNGDPSNIYIGWTFNNQTPTYTINGAKHARYPVALFLDNAGSLLCNSTYDGKYWEVPRNVSNSGSSPYYDYQSLSLASRFYRNNLLCTYYYYYGSSSGNNDVFYKLPLQNHNGLREETSEATLVFSPNPFTSSVEVVIPNEVRNLTDLVLNVYDVMGKNVFTRHGNTAFLNKELSSLSGKLQSGIYLFKLYSPSKEQQWLQKMIKL